MWTRDENGNSDLSCIPKLRLEIELRITGIDVQWVCVADGREISNAIATKILTGATCSPCNPNGIFEWNQGKVQFYYGANGRSFGFEAMDRGVEERMLLDRIERVKTWIAGLDKYVSRFTL